MSVFTSIFDVTVPRRIACGKDGKNAAFEITFSADGDIPFPQVVLTRAGRVHLVKDDLITKKDAGTHVTFTAQVPAGLLASGEVGVQVEGCTRADFENAGGGEWIKDNRTLEIDSPPRPEIKPLEPGEAKIYFGIHKHMHQPYYNTTDRDYWDGEKDEIFGSRGGNYTDFVPAAVRQYIDGGLPHAGLSTSWSGTLIEQLDRCARDGLCGGRFGQWNQALREIAGERTALGHPRVTFTAFGFFHPLMALIPSRNIVKHIDWHRDIIRSAFGVEPSNILFPPETAFHVRMIPALLEAGIEAVIYDSIHRYRACQNYPYAGIQEGMLPPNPADQENPQVSDWLRLHNIWAGSEIAPSLLRPEYVKYEDPEGKTYKLIAVPAERYIGNEDARGGFGALQYPDVLGQVYDQVVKTGTFDPQHPPFFLLHSDGDNHGGGADSYYYHNTGALVRWLQEDPRFELTTIGDYLERFPPDPSKAVHIEPGSWAGADNGDPQFMKWFSRYHDPYSPDLNSWAVLTAFQNVVHSLEDNAAQSEQLESAVRLMLTAETSCYWYWTGQTVWDVQVTQAANMGLAQLKGVVDALVARGGDRSGPTIFAPWVTPENPGGKKWGQGRLEDADRVGTVHTFVHDVSGLKRVSLVMRANGSERTLDMKDHGPYPSQVGAQLSAHYLTCQLPEGAGLVRYYIEAEDQRGNVSRSTLERVFLA